MRQIGTIRPRRLPPFKGWASERFLAFGLPGFKLFLSQKRMPKGVGKLRVIRKACHFDGMLGGRFEILLTCSEKYPSREAKKELIDWLLESKYRANPSGQTAIQGVLKNAGEAVTQIWANATIRHNTDPQSQFVFAGSPTLILETTEQVTELSEENILEALFETESRTGLPDPFGATEIRHEMSRLRKHALSLRVDLHSKVDATCFGEKQANSISRRVLRYVRTYTIRLIQDIEAIIRILGTPECHAHGDNIQLALNEYTRRVLKARKSLSDQGEDQLIELSYAIHEKLFPGKIAGLRSTITASNIRPNVKRKLIELLDEVQDSSNVYIEEFNVMNGGDVYKNINATGQGQAIGRGAQANVSGSKNIDQKALSEDLLKISKLIAEDDSEDAEQQAANLKAAAEKLEEGDEDGAVAMLKKSAGWVLGIITASGSAVLTAFVKARLGL